MSRLGFILRFDMRSTADSSHGIGLRSSSMGTPLDIEASEDVLFMILNSNLSCRLCGRARGLALTSM